MWQVCRCHCVDVAVLLFWALGVVGISGIRIIWFSVWFSYKLDHFPSS
jgi:hypothetical protein